MIGERITIHNVAKQTNDPNDWKQFRQFRNYVTSKERQRQQDYISELDNKVSNSTNFGNKEWWKLVKSFLNKKGIESNEIPPILHEGTVHYSNEEKANVFNTFFIAQSTLENSNDDVPDVPYVIPEISEISLTLTDVKNVIENLKTNKAVGPDLIHNRLLIAALPVIYTLSFDFHF